MNLVIADRTYKEILFAFTVFCVYMYTSVKPVHVHYLLPLSRGFQAVFSYRLSPFPIHLIDFFHIILLIPDFPASELKTIWLELGWFSPFLV